MSLPKFNWEDMSIGLAVAVILAFAGLAAIGIWVFMVLWNWVMPMIFGLPTINYWMSLGIILITHFLFGWPNNQ